MFARLFTERVKVQNKHVCMGLLTIAHCQYYNPAANASQEFDEELVRCYKKTPEVFHRFTTTLTKHIMNNIQASCSSLHQAAMLLLLARRRNGWEVQKESLDL